MNARSTIIAVISVGALLAAVFAIWETMQSPSLKINSAPFIGVGQVLAEDAAKSINDRGHVLAVVAAEHQQSSGPLHDEWRAFCSELQKHASITLDATETVAPDPNDLEPGAGCPVAAFKSILERHGQEDAIVFFMGLPAWSSLRERSAIPTKVSSKILVFDPLVMRPKSRYGEYFRQQIVTELIIGWGGSGGQVENPKTPREWFDTVYQVFSSQNFDGMPN